MRYDQFQAIVKDFPLISGQYLKLISANSPTLKNQLVRWQKSGKLIKLKKGFYILNEANRKINPSRLFVACELYKPSYISLEYALSMYGIIPERVVDITCITSKKTTFLENIFGRFIYQQIKTACFTGFTEQKDETGLNYYMATPEKAVVDFLYLNLSSFKENYTEILLESFRFQNLEILNAKKLAEYAEFFENKKLKEIIKTVKLS